MLLIWVYMHQYMVKLMTLIFCVCFTMLLPKDVEKHVKAQIVIITWTPIVAKEVGDRFHQNFQVSLW
jgi:hypothetical protein